MKSLDLRRHITLGIEHMRNTLDERRGFLPFFSYRLVAPPVSLSHGAFDCPHVVGRYLDAMSRCHGIVDTPDDSLEVSAMRRFIHSSIGENGLAWNRAAKHQKEEVVTHNQREVLEGLTGLGRWKDCDNSRKLARRVCRGIDQATRDSSGFPGPRYGRKGWGHPPEDQRYHRYGPPRDSGRLIGALVDYFRLTKDSLAVELAIRFARYNMSVAFDENGSIAKTAGTHVHSITGTVAGFVALGLLIHDRALIEAAKRIYDMGLASLRSSFGWVKESLSDDSDKGLPNNIADVIKIALRLGKAGFTEYFEDAERMVRNHLIASQLMDTSWIQETGDMEDTLEVIYRDVARRAKGGFAFCTPNDFADLKNHPHGPEEIHADMVGGSLQGLCEAWNSIVWEDEVGIRINLLLTVDTDLARVRSSMPHNGKVLITPLKNTNLLVRIPSWCDRDELIIIKGGKTIPTTQQGAYLAIWDARHSEEIEVSFPMVKRTTKECVNHKTYTVEWLGDTVVSISPQGSFRPLYIEK